MNLRVSGCSVLLFKMIYSDISALHEVALESIYLSIYTYYVVAVNTKNLMTTIYTTNSVWIVL